MPRQAPIIPVMCKLVRLFAFAWDFSSRKGDLFFQRRLGASRAVRLLRGEEFGEAEGGRSPQGRE